MSPFPRSVSLTAFAVALLLACSAPALAQAAPSKPGGITSATGPGGRNITAFDRKTQGGIGGYYDLEYVQPFAAKPSFFDNHRLILQVSSYLHENVMFNAEIEFEHGAVLNNGLADGEMRIEQAWSDWRLDDAFSLRAGVLLIPFGIVNVLHDSDVRETTARPLMASTIVPTTWMEAGVGAHGVLYPLERLMLNYDVVLTNGLTDQISAADGLRQARPSLKTDNNSNKAVAGRLGISPVLGLEVGLNGYYGAVDGAGLGGLAMGGADLAWAVGPFELIGEYARVATPGGTTVLAGKTAASEIPLGMQGYYLEGRYRFFPAALEETLLGRAGGFEHATFTLFARGGAADTNLSASDASDKIEAVVGINYRPIQTFVPKIELRHLAEPITGVTSDTLWASVAAGF